MSVDAEKPEELLYANHAVIDIFGCRDLDDFKKHTGYTGHRRRQYLYRKCRIYESIKIICYRDMK